MEHPIKLLPGLVQLWRRNWNHAHGEFGDYLATQAVRWGADQELEACIDVILAHPGLEHPELLVEVLRAARRPKPPSLVEQALELVDRIEKAESVWNMRELDTIRRALERLKELEQQENNDN